MFACTDLVVTSALGWHTFWGETHRLGSLKNNVPTTQGTYERTKTSVLELLTRRIHWCIDCFCLGICSSLSKKTHQKCQYKSIHSTNRRVLSRAFQMWSLICCSLLGLLANLLCARPHWTSNSTVTLAPILSPETSVFKVFILVWAKSHCTVVKKYFICFNTLSIFLLLLKFYIG